MTPMDKTEATRIALEMSRAAALASPHATVDQVLNAFGSAVGSYIGCCAFIDRDLLIEAMMLIVNKQALASAEKFCKDHDFEPRRMQ